eukprot:gnl/MRDRNA2_/MRDRNA2_29706_c0_seq1.p1 gnl/MRDRNA2_/MRDRNA2_29706_c0~~gnl/MRDRNA2_/MRDRNA2_29706_c0_seq1.p1  ORF type:complete len:503 (+),score=70.11 gnl/MRDRNA2_/MRDRNA2_29706_c0_seq1:100-1608(+)
MLHNQLMLAVLVLVMHAHAKKFVANFKVSSDEQGWSDNMTLWKPCHLNHGMVASRHSALLAMLSLGFPASWSRGLHRSRLHGILGSSRRWEGRPGEENAESFESGRPYGRREYSNRGRGKPDYGTREPRWQQGMWEGENMGRENTFYGRQEHWKPEYGREGRWEQGRWREDRMGMGGAGWSNMGMGQGTEKGQTGMGDMVLTGSVRLMQRLASLGFRLVGFRGLIGLMILVGLAGLLGQIALAGTAVVAVAGVGVGLKSGGAAEGAGRIKAAASAAAAALSGSTASNGREGPDNAGLQGRAFAATRAAASLESRRTGSGELRGRSDFPGPYDDWKYGREPLGRGYDYNPSHGEPLDQGYRGRPERGSSYHQPEWGAPPDLVENELLSGWEVAVEHGSGRKYYYNRSTGQVQWEPPIRSTPPNLHDPYRQVDGTLPGNAYAHNRNLGAFSDGAYSPNGVSNNPDVVAAPGFPDAKPQGGVPPPRRFRANPGQTAPPASDYPPR